MKDIIIGALVLWSVFIGIYTYNQSGAILAVVGQVNQLRVMQERQMADFIERDKAYERLVFSVMSEETARSRGVLNYRKEKEKKELTSR